MKKFILSIAIMLTCISMSFANRPDIINQRAVSSFQSRFHQASDVSWKQTRNYFQATFMMNRQIMFAYYDGQGNLMALTHNMLTSSLPEYLQNQLKKLYTKYWITECFELSNEEGIRYFVEIKNAKETTVLSSDGTDSWQVYTRQKTNLIDF
jgi:hypothetical protein